MDNDFRITAWHPSWSNDSQPWQFPVQRIRTAGTIKMMRRFSSLGRCWGKLLLFAALLGLLTLCGWAKFAQAAVEQKPLTLEQLESTTDVGSSGRCHPAVTEVRATVDWGELQAQATDGGLLLRPRRISPGTSARMWTTCEGLPSNRVTALSPFSGKLLVAMLGGGVVVVEGQADGSPHIRRLPGLTHLRVTSVTTMPDSSVWYGTAENGLWRWSPDGKTHQPIGSLRKGLISALLRPVDSNVLFVGRGPLGADRLQPDGRHVRILRDRYVRAIRMEGQSVVADTPEGVCTLDPPPRRATCSWTGRPFQIPMATTEGPPSNHITSLVVHDQALWVGTFERGLAWTRDGLHWNRIDPAAAPHILLYINQLASDNRFLWVASPHGAARWDGHAWRFYNQQNGLASDHVNAILPIGEVVWFATSQGITRLDRSGPVTFDEHAGLPHRIVYSLSRRPEFGIVAGTHGGLAFYDGKQWSKATLEQGQLADNWINAVAFWKGMTWAGTYDAGIDRLPDRNRSEHVSTAGPVWVNPNGFSVTPNVLLVSTLGDGLLATDGIRWISWKAPNWIPETDVTATACYQGRLWVGTRSGLTSWFLKDGKP